MFYRDGGEHQFESKVEKPNPAFANALQKAIGIQVEIRFCLQHLFQFWGSLRVKEIPGHVNGNGLRRNGP